MPPSAFYDHFQSAEECYLAAFDEGIARLSRVVAEAAGREASRLGRIRAGLVALLGFFDNEPQWGRLLLIDAPAGCELECRRRAQGVLGELLGEECGELIVPTELLPAPALMSDLILGGVFSVIRERMLDSIDGPLTELAPSLMSFIITPYLGQSAVSTGLTGAPPAGAGEPEGETSSGLAELPIRATYRTTCVLRAISSAPRSSNREIAQAAGLTDEGQTSKLLSRLEQRGLIENVGLGAAHGEPNAWLLTPAGRRVVQAIGHGFALGAAVQGIRRVRGAA